MDSFDQLNIDTPEQIALELPLAGIGSRFLAFAIDTLIQAALYIIAGIVFFLILGLGTSMWWYVPGSVGPAVGIFILFAIYWGYFAAFEALWKGQTPGKRYAGIRVIKESGRPINAFEAIGRNSDAGRGWAARNLWRGAGLHDDEPAEPPAGRFCRGTVVVHEKRTEEVRPTWNTATDAGSATGAMGQVTADELVLIETYLSRRWELDPQVRLRTAIQIADRIKAKTGMEPQGHQHVDDFLEESARKIRDGGRFR